MYKYFREKNPAGGKQIILNIYILENSRSKAKNQFTRICYRKITDFKGYIYWFTILRYGNT